MSKLFTFVLVVASLAIGVELCEGSHTFYSCAEPDQASKYKIKSLIESAGVKDNELYDYTSLRDLDVSNFHMSLQKINSGMRVREFHEYTEMSKKYSKEVLTPKLTYLKGLLSKVQFKIDRVSSMGAWVALELEPDFTSLKRKDQKKLKDFFQGRPHLSLAKFNFSDSKHVHSANLLMKRISDLIKKKDIFISFDKVKISSPCLIDYSDKGPIYRNLQAMSF